MQRLTVAALPGGLQVSGWRRWALLVVALVVFVLALALVLPVGVDYGIFTGAARAWISGESSLFDGAALGFFYAPWSMFLFVPLSFLPDRLGSALINAASIGALLLAYRLLVGSAPWYVVMVSIANVYTANLVGSSQFDALTTAAVALAFVAAEQRRPWLLGAVVAFAGIKPTNVWLPLLVVALGMACKIYPSPANVALARVAAPLQSLILGLAGGGRGGGRRPKRFGAARGRDLEGLRPQWERQHWLQAAIIPALCIGAGFVISGADWPLRYLDFVAAHPPNAGYNASFWILRGAGALPLGMAAAAVAAAAGALVLSIRSHGLGGATIAVALVLNLLISPYVTIYHYVAMIPALVWLGKRDVLYTALLYVAAVAWVIIQSGEPWLLPIYPLAVALALLVALLWH
jgi:hypothetical protein